MTLPYESATSGKNAIADMQRVLQTFGATSFGVMENFARGDVLVQFVWHDRSIAIKASAKGYAAAWLRHHPYSYRTKGTQTEHERKALKQANISVYSILRDWIKGQVTAIEVGTLSFDGAFLGQIMLPTGETVLERVEATKMLQIAQSP